MNYLDPGLWFSWKERINRRPYIFASLAAGGLLKAYELIPQDNTVLVLCYFPILLLAIYITFVLRIKRAHDRGKSGFFVVLFFVPILNLWPMIELIFFRGTDGPNQFGPDPLQDTELSLADNKKPSKNNWLKILGALAVIAVIASVVVYILYKPTKEPPPLSDDDVKTMLKKHNFFDNRLNESGDFKNDFKDNGNGTVTDRKTGLMWQKGSSSDRMIFKDTADYVRQVNRKGLGGYNDWRLPTLEELASLLERQRVNGLFIDPVFDKKQRWCWSSDKRAGGGAWVVYFDLGGAWLVSFSSGHVLWSDMDLSVYVRVCRS